MTTAPPTRKFPFDDRDAILSFEKRYWEFCKPDEVSTELAIQHAMPKARRKGQLSRALFLKMARWKSKRPTRRYVMNTEGEVRVASRLAYQARTEGDAIRALADLHGVGLRTATALLHWMRPKEFPILDFRIVGALGEKEPESWEDVAYYSRIAARVRELTGKYGVSLREMDRALWAWQKLEAGKAGKRRSRCR